MSRFGCILLVVASLLVAGSGVRAAVGTAFTYQGRLLSEGEPFDGAIDLTFRLYDAADGGNQVGADFVSPNHDVAEGFVTIELDFGPGAFDGSSRWLEIEVDSEVLSPRQPILPTPYAMFAVNGGSGSPGAQWSYRATQITTDASVGIGTSSPLDLLHVAGGNATLRLEDTSVPGGGFTQIYDAQPTQLRFSKTNNNGVVLMDFNPKAADGVSSSSVRLFRETNTTGPKALTLHRGNNTNSVSAQIGVDGLDSFFQLHGGNVGIGTSTPTSKLHVIGDATATGIVQSLSPDLQSSVFLGWTTDENGDEMARIRIGGNGVGASNGLDIERVADVSLMRITNAGRVGIGTTLPATKLHVAGVIRTQSGPDIMDITQNSFNTAGDGFFGDPLYLNNDNAESVLIGFGGGNVGIGGGTAGFPVVRLHVDAGSDAALGSVTAGYLLVGPSNGANIVMDNNEIMARSSTAASTLFLNHEGGQVHIGQASGGTGRLLTPVLQITGGSDLSENFDVTTTDGTLAEPGMVVCIDPANPGKLIPSTRAYDRTVAGVISGAGGVKPGMLMGQSDTIADGDHPVALTGRVYVMCDAAQGAIEPGDLLTTADVPGHAMKVADHGRAQGAIIGKAMTALPYGERGLVLVLVSLQ